MRLHHLAKQLLDTGAHAHMIPLQTSLCKISIHSFINPSTYPHNQLPIPHSAIYESIHPSIHQSFHPTMHETLRPFITYSSAKYPSTVSPSIHLSIHLCWNQYCRESTFATKFQTIYPDSRTTYRVRFSKIKVRPKTGYEGPEGE